jgi:tRNA(Ser,Leu) C12 N-acetylase TAN1
MRSPPPVAPSVGLPSEAPDLDWNVVLTVRAGHRRRLRRALHRLVFLRRSGFHNVFVGRVSDAATILEGVATLGAARPDVLEWIGRIVPVERTFAVDAAHFADQVVTEAAPLLDRLAGRRFHVRVERRGHKHVIHSQETVQRVGETLLERLAAQSPGTAVDFRDPDVVVVVEIVGPAAGVGLVTREQRQRFPFVRID